MVDTSDSSEDEKNPGGGKASKLQIVDVAENDEHSSAEEKEKKEPEKPVVKKIRKKKTTTRKEKSNPPKTSNPNPRRREKVTPTGLNGNYWNIGTTERQPTKPAVDPVELDEDTTSSNEEVAREKLQKILSSSSEDRHAPLYENRTFVTCRNPTDAFFLCQVLQNVYSDTQRIRIRWCALVDENGDENNVDENTRFKLDYEDTLDLQTILTGIPNIIRHPDRTLSLRKQDIFETNRLLEKSIKGESISSDEPMEVAKDKETTEPAIDRDLYENSSGDDSLAIRSATPKAKKRTKTATSPQKKRVRVTSGEAAPIRKRRRTKDVNEVNEAENETTKPKRTAKKTAAKPVTTAKAQLFKVQSNRWLKENPAITVYRSEPFFEDNIPVPYISSSVQGKLAIRAVLLNDTALLESLIDSVDRVCSVHIRRDFPTSLCAIHFAVKIDNIDLLRILLQDLKSPKKDRCPFPEVTLARQSTGSASIRTFGFRTAPLMASRGAREGNNALNKDSGSVFIQHNGNEILQYALKTNCSREVFDLLIENFPHYRPRIYKNISQSIRAGHRKLAASIIDEIKTNSFHGFNALHHQVLLFDDEELTIKHAVSVVKKSKENFQITPIHCAAINPNPKYLKQLLAVIPEYNILDKYERRPIHFAAVCEGPAPLEYLLSRHVNFNDVDRGGNAPLHAAVTNGRAINAEILLRTAKEKAESNDSEDQLIHQKFGLASINRINKSRLYPLHLAVMNNHLECVKVLLEFGANVDAVTSTSSGKLTPLMLACQQGNLKVVIHLIEQGTRVEARDRFKRTPLIHACMYGNVHIVSHLLRMGANANACDSSMNTALHYSIAYGWYFCVRLLLEAGANANAVNSWQTTCLAAGFSKGHYGLCDYLLTEHKVNINFKTDDGLTLVMLTADLRVSASAVQQLEYVVVKHKADCTGVDANGRNAFHYLARNATRQQSSASNEAGKTVLRKNLFRMAEILLDHQCNPLQMDNRAQTPLMIALECGNFILVDYLINQGKAEVNAEVSHDGKTLLHYFALQCIEEELLDLLFALPVNDELKKMGQLVDNHGRTPFHYCVEKFNAFCEQQSSSDATETLTKQYRSIVKMIEYCLETIGCDPDLGIKLNDDQKKSSAETIDDEPTTISEVKTDNEEKSIFFLLRTATFAGDIQPHPLEYFLKKTKSVNVLHPKTHRTPLLEAIHLQEHRTSRLLIEQAACDINLASSTADAEQGQTPLIRACQLLCLPIIRDLLNHPKCDLLARDRERNQALHYYLATSQRSNVYLKIFHLFVSKLKAAKNDILNSQGKGDRTPLHIAVYHNLGTIDAINDVEQTLIDHKCDLFIKDDLGNLPLHNVFLTKVVAEDPVELCVLLLKSMDYKSLDTKNHQGNTPLYLAVEKSSIVCVMLLQEHRASLTIENNLSNSIVGHCIASNHLNLFITFLHQTTDLDLGKLYTLKSASTPEKRAKKPSRQVLGSFSVQSLTTTTKKKKKDEHTDLWTWKYANLIKTKLAVQQTLISIIIERDWQGALSLILNELERFHLKYIQIFEAALGSQKLNLVLGLLSRLKDHSILNGKNSHGQNLFHLLANMQNFDVHLFEKILTYLHEHHVDWNLSDEFGSSPLHYASVKQNYPLINFLRKHYAPDVDFNQTDASNNPAYGLLFWSAGTQSSVSTDQLRLLISAGRQLDCVCNYDNGVAIDPLSFGCVDSSSTKANAYPPIRADNGSNDVRTSPLINAIVHNHFPLVKFLLELGADVNYPDEEKRTPLIYAVRQNNLDMVKLLLNPTYSLPKPDPPADNGLFGRTTPRSTGAKFFLGVSHAEPDVEEDISDPVEAEKFTVTSSVDLNASDALGRTCIHYLVQPFSDGSYTNNIDLLQLLHASGASLTQCDLAGLSPLQYGAINGCQHLCDILTKLIGDEQANSTQASIERFYINDPNKKLLEQTDFYADAQHLIEQYLAKHPSQRHNAAYQVDPLSDMSQTGEVLIDTEKNKPYDVRLTKTDVDYGTYGFYNFYRMQIIKHKSKANLYLLFTRWGRIGDGDGQHQLTPFSTLDECRKEFCKVFREKTGNLWKDTDQFQSKPKKYTLIQLNEREMQKHSNVPIDFPRLRDDQQRPASKLESSVYETFLDTLISPQAIRSNLTKTQLDVEWMPVSQLKRESLDKARNILLQLKTDIERKQKLTLEMAQSKSEEQKAELKLLFESISKHTNDYYTIVPLRGYAEEKLPMIDNEQILKQQGQTLDDILELELSYKLLLGAQANLNKISPLDYLYRSINCQFEAMNKDNIDSQLILRYIWSSAPTVQVEQIFKIARPGEDERLLQRNLDNHYLLWHGTNICNLISILTRGLLVGPLAAASTGSSFGKGIYSADIFAKSLGYCSGAKQEDGERCFMLLCEVALGTSKEIGAIGAQTDDDDVTKPLDLTQFQSRKAMGNSIPDPRHTIIRNYGVRMPLGKLIPYTDGQNRYARVPYNEYIVYDESQVALRYLVQFRR